MALKIQGHNLAKRMINGQQVSKIMRGYAQVRPDNSSEINLPWIYWSPELELVTMSSDWNTWLTFKDKNVGATEVYPWNEHGGNYNMKWPEFEWWQRPTPKAWWHAMSYNDWDAGTWMLNTLGVWPYWWMDYATMYTISGWWLRWWRMWTWTPASLNYYWMVEYGYWPYGWFRIREYDPSSRFSVRFALDTPVKPTANWQVRFQPN